MTPAQALTNSVRAAVSKYGARLFPVSVGKFWAGQVVGKLPNGDTVLRNARIVNVGIKGQSDLGGFTPVKITAEMVGTTLPVICAVEIKAGKDRVTPEQKAYVDYILSVGGRAGVARSVEDATNIIRGGVGDGAERNTK